MRLWNAIKQCDKRNAEPHATNVVGKSCGTFVVSGKVILLYIDKVEQYWSPLNGTNQKLGSQTRYHSFSVMPLKKDHIFN